MILGDAEVGKTSLLNTFNKCKSSTSTVSTIGIDFVIHKTEVDGLPLQVKFWDTAGQERNKQLTLRSLKHADGMIVAFDLTSQSSFRNCQ